MSIFKNTRRIVDHVVHKKISSLTLSIANKDSKFCKRKLENNQFTSEEVGYNSNVVNKNISPQCMANTRTCNNNSKNYLSPGIHYKIPNDKTILERQRIQKHINKRYKDRQNQRKRNYEKGLPKGNISQQQILVDDIPRPFIYDIVSHNHVIAPTEGILSNQIKLKANRNQVIYHRVYNVPEEEREISFQPIKHVTWFSKRDDQNKGERSLGRLGNAGSGNESEFFFKNDREKLMELKKKMKDKEKGPDVPKKG